MLLFIGSTAYTVDQTEQAVLITWGKPSEEQIGAGLKFKLPYPIQKVKILSTETFSMPFGYTEADGQATTVMHDAKMITGDENIVLADLEVQWRITDPIKYLYSNEDPVKTLHAATSASLRGIIGSSKVDDALTDGKTRIINDVRENLIKLVNSYDMGIAVVAVNLQDVELPTKEVEDAFNAVNSARETKLTKVNEANRYKNEIVNKALGEKKAKISTAELEKNQRIEKAKGDVATFNAVYSEYVNNKNVTKQRLVIEAMNKVLPGAKVYIMDENSGTVKYLPIDTVEKK